MKKEQCGEQMNITGVFLHILADALGRNTLLHC
jgi:Co/Zn/Cd efflux system component